MSDVIEGTIVHFVLNSGPSAGEDRPAIIVKVWRDASGNPPVNGCSNLVVFLDGSNDAPRDEQRSPAPLVVWKTSILRDEGRAPNTWH